MRLPLLTLLLLAACKGDKLSATPVCGMPCYTGASTQVNVGVCRAGTWACDEDGKPSTCVDEVLPSDEVCDGQDNDCDGKVDNHLGAAGVQPCSTACGQGVIFCQNGSFSECSARKPEPEVCDGVDNDCDGLIDEGEDLPVKFCYTGVPATSVSYGICHPGSTRCIGGEEKCVGDRVPEPEVCDGVDNNCNGIIDDGQVSQNQDVDFVIVFDNSSSMSGVANNLKAAVQSWAIKYQNRPGQRYALITAPDTAVLLYGNTPHMESNFSGAAAFDAAMAMQNGTTGSGEEATIDALYETVDPVNPFGLSWNPGSKHMVFVFSDELPQSYANPQVSLDDLVTRLSAGGTTVHVFTSFLDKTTHDDWQRVATAGGGQVWDIHSDEADLEQDLDDIIKVVTCGP